MSTRERYGQFVLAALGGALLVFTAAAQESASPPSVLAPVTAEYTETLTEYQEAGTELRAETEDVSRRLDQVRAEFGMAEHLPLEQVADRALVACCDEIAVRNHLEAELPPFLYSPSKTELKAMLDGENFPSVSAAVWEGSETTYLAGIDPSTLTPGWKTLAPAQMMPAVGLELERLRSLADWPPFLLAKSVEARPSTKQLRRNVDSLRERRRRAPAPSFAQIDAKRRELEDMRDRLKKALILMMRVQRELHELEHSFEEGRMSADEVRAKLRRDFPLVEARIKGGSEQNGREIVNKLDLEVVKIAEKPVARIEHEVNKKFPDLIKKLESELAVLKAQRRDIKELDERNRLAEASLLRAERSDKAFWEKRLATLRGALEAVREGRMTLLEFDERLRLLRTLREQGRGAR